MEVILRKPSGAATWMTWPTNVIYIYGDGKPPGASLEYILMH